MLKTLNNVIIRFLLNLNNLKLEQWAIDDAND